MLLASAALLAICYGLVEGQKYNWGTITGIISIPLILGAGVVLLAVFLVVQKLGQQGEPLVPFAVFRDRGFSVMNLVSALLSIGMMGIFLPFTIYLQSVLGFSALKAGLAMAPASLISVFIAPVAGRMTDKMGGKYLLMGGLFLFGVGMGSLALIATPTSAWYVFLPSLLVAGVGMGFTFAPLTTTAMRNIEPRMAGAASGVLNTVRQVGLVIGTAGVGALLQNRLADSLVSQARQRSTALPGPIRSHLISGFASAAKGGVQIGAGQSGGSVKVAPGVPGPAGRGDLPDRRPGVRVRLRGRHAGDDVGDRDLAADRVGELPAAARGPPGRHAGRFTRRRRGAGRDRDRRADARLTSPAQTDRSGADRPVRCRQTGPAQTVRSCAEAGPAQTGRSCAHGQSGAGQGAGARAGVAHSPRSSSGSGSNGNRGANAGTRSDSQMACGSNWA